MFRLGYNTNGLAHHRVGDAFELLASLGYEGVAITPDVGELDLYALDANRVAELRSRADDLGLALTVETGARYLLDPRRKHFPTLLETSASDRARRVDFLRRSIDLAVDLGAELVSMWSGAAPGGEVGDRPGATGDERPAEHPEVWDRLVAGVEAALEHARASGVRLAFEPEPGMFVERPSGYLALRERLGERASELGLTLDIGHLLVTGDLPVGEQVRQLGPYLTHVHLDDVRDGVHEHRMLGDGVLNLHETLSALLHAGYSGMVALELSRDSHRGAWAAQESMGRLRQVLAELNPGE
ncbi:MAG: sugar phosphate isomerase/epimerase [Planctomycetes bacterium]|nr:sugar phosphate isomerase/epimerase [Planctomycetota bacterium]